MNKLSILIIVSSLFFLSACKMIDQRTPYALENKTQTDYDKGKELLEMTYKKMGYDKLKNIKTIQVNALYKWKPIWAMMPMNPLPGSNKNNLVFKFATNTFDGNVHHLEGRKKGKTFGIQSFEDYQIKKGELKQKKAKHQNWGLATYHYVIEAPKRLLSAEIIRYAGEEEFEGQKYDLVYVTWGKDEPHKEHDQWVVYINKATGFTDMTKITINDYFLPMPNGMKGGTIRTTRTNVNGIYLPDAAYIQLGDPKALKKAVYNFKLTNYKFDTFPLSELYPFNDIDRIGDNKK